MSYIVLLDRWCHTVPNHMHQLRRKVTNQQKAFMRNLSRFPIVFPVYHTKIMLRDFNAKLGRERTFLNWLLGMRFYIRLVTIMFLEQWTVPHQKFLVFQSMMFPHQNIPKYTWTSPDGKTYNQIDHILTDRRCHLSILNVWAFKGADCDTDHYLADSKVRERLAVNIQAAQKFVGRFNLRKLSVRG